MCIIIINMIFKLLLLLNLLYYFSEKKKKKLTVQQSDNKDDTNTNIKPDKSYLSNVMMVACIILTFPYDMPRFLPALVTSFVKHKNTAVVQNTVLKVIQNFKRTHQDRYSVYNCIFYYLF